MSLLPQTSQIAVKEEALFRVTPQQDWYSNGQSPADGRDSGIHSGGDASGRRLEAGQRESRSNAQGQ